MANETTSSDITARCQTAIAEVRYQMETKIKLLDAKYIRLHQLKKGENKSKFPFVNGLTATELTEGNEVSAQQWGDSEVNITPAYNAVARVDITDLANFFTDEQYQVDFGKEVAKAFRKKANQDIIALFSGFSNAGGGTGQTITEAMLRAARTSIRNNYGEGKIILPLHSYGVEQLIALYSSKDVNVPDKLIESVYQGTAEYPIYGIYPVEIPGGSFAADENGDVTTACFTTDAIGGSVAWDIKVEAQRNAAKVGWELVASAAYEVKELRDGEGYGLVLDAAA